MRTALTLLVLVSGLSAGGCSSSYGTDSCRPKCERCPKWQPNCCNNWDWYVPCDMIEGRAVRDASSYDTVPTCSCAR